MNAPPKEKFVKNLTVLNRLALLAVLTGISITTTRIGFWYGAKFECYSYLLINNDIITDTNHVLVLNIFNLKIKIPKEIYNAIR